MLFAKSTIYIPSAIWVNTSEMKTAEFANSPDLDEVAHNEPPHIDLHSLPSNL